MAKRKTKTSNLTKFVICLMALVLGIAGGAFAYIYYTAPDTEVLNVGTETFYSKTSGAVTTSEISVAEGNMSVHFLELGNKYTGDCTYIKVGENIDILIDCGSRANSVATISEYLNNYVTDGSLEYVIITHAHQDHYAGFATSTTVDSIFDLYDCKNIIDFGDATNQKSSAKLYSNYIRERTDEINKNANYYSVTNSSYYTDGEPNDNFTSALTFTLDATNNIYFEVLYNYYYNHTDSYTSGENNFSVCTLFHQGSGDNEKKFLFTGDLEEDGEEYLVTYNKNNEGTSKLENVDLYKAGHHGSKTSSSTTLLDVIKPEYVCVCCCAGSPEYKASELNTFPTQTFINNVSQYTDNIFVTTLCVDYDNDQYESMNGNIVIVAVLNQDIGVNCSNNNTLLKDTEWFKSNRTYPSKS